MVDLQVLVLMQKEDTIIKADIEMKVDIKLLKKVPMDQKLGDANCIQELLVNL